MKRLLLSLLLLSTYFIGLPQINRPIVNGWKYTATLVDMNYSRDKGLVNTAQVFSGTRSGAAFDNYGIGYRYLASGHDGWIESKFVFGVPSDASAGIIYFSDTILNRRYDVAPYYLAAAYVYLNQLYYLDGNLTGHAAVHTFVADGYWRIRRAGSVLKLEVSSDDVTWTNPTTPVTFTTTSTGLFYAGADLDITIAGTNKLYYPKAYGLTKYPRWILCDGNSQTEGVGSTSSPLYSYPSVIQQQNLTLRIINKGVSGQTTGDMIADASTDIDPNYSNTITCVDIAWEMGNDLFFYGSVDSAYSRMKQYCNARRAVGWKVVVGTIPYRNYGANDPAGDTPAQYEVKRLAVNDSVRNHYLTFSDGLADIGNRLGFSNAKSAADSGFYNSDSIHFNNGGYAVIAAFFFPIANTVRIKLRNHTESLCINIDRNRDIWRKVAA